MKRTNITIATAATLSLSLAFGGCGASIPSLSTGSLLGGSNTAKENRDPNDPVARAMGVAATSARALKCGYNFDPGKLKSQYLTYETTASPMADQARLAQIYDTSFSSVSKTIVAKEKEEEEQYCVPDRTARIKAALNRNLAGDYTPPPSEAPEDSGGIFSGWGGGSSGNEEGGAKMKEMMGN